MGDDWNVPFVIPASFAYYSIKDYEYKDFYDRAYLLRINPYQLRIDRTFLLGGVIGGSLMFYKKKRIIDGMASGCTFALFGCTLYNVHIWRSEQKILFEE